MAKIVEHIIGPYASLVRDVHAYFKRYGGVGALFLSPFLHVAGMITFIFPVAWKQGVSDSEAYWSGIAISVLPSLLGFSLGGLAITLAFSSTRFFRRISEEGNPNSFYVKLTSNFVHFIIMQSIALILAIITSVSYNVFVSAVGFFLMIYSVLTTISIALAIFTVARINNAEMGADDASHGPVH